MINIIRKERVSTIKDMRTVKLNRNDLEAIEALVADAAWQPWLLPIEVSQRIIRLIPPGYRKRFRFYFDDYGCLRCRRKDIRFLALGFCENCHSMVAKRMRRSMKRHRSELLGSRSSSRIRWYIDQVTHAQELLSDFVARKARLRTPSNGRHIS